jgi:hypothetical protein
MFFRNFAFLAATMLTGFHLAHAQESRAFELFESEEPVRIELAFDMRRLVGQKYNDEYQKADITLTLPDSSTESASIRIKARGEFRRRFCALPPIFLNFKDADLSHPALKGLGKVKLVTACRYQAQYEQYLFQEYLAYRVFNELTPISYRVQLVQIRFVDVSGRSEPFEQYGFMIEETKRMAERNAAFEMETEVVPERQLDREYMTMVYVFEYLIGNTDWWVPNSHNVRILKPKDPLDLRTYAVPYDFDFCGMVNAHYASPHDELPIERVRERLYRGLYRTEAELREVFGHFELHKSDIYRLYEDFPYLRPEQRKQSLAYLDEFYRTIQNPYKVEKEFLQASRR